MVKLFLIMSLLASILVLPARAADSLETEFARAELLSAVEATGNLSEIQLGLQVTLQPGWKIYWRSPGDAGLPTQLSIQEAASSKLKLTIAYPCQSVFLYLVLIHMAMVTRSYFLSGDWSFTWSAIRFAG